MSDSSFLIKMRTLTESRNHQKKTALPLEELIVLANQKQRPAFLFEKAFRKNNSPKVIAEIKKSSPSQGDLNLEIVPSALAAEYDQAGAAAISVLTEPSFFGGSTDDLKNIRLIHPTLVLLQKDFVIDPYQIYEAKFLGADAVLLIVAMLGEKQTRDFKEIATSLGLSCLVEVHNLEELNIALKVDAKIIGINNRNLHTLKISLNVSRELAALIPESVIAISESGIKDSGEINELHKLGFEGFLIGSSLMKTSSPGKQLGLLLEGVSSES